MRWRPHRFACEYRGRHLTREVAGRFFGSVRGRERTLDEVGRSFLPVSRPDLAGRSAFSPIFFDQLWYKTTKYCLNLSRIAFFAARLSLILLARPYEWYKIAKIHYNYPG